jgi:hypothetical protein
MLAARAQGEERHRHLAAQVQRERRECVEAEVAADLLHEELANRCEPACRRDSTKCSA